MSNQSLVKLPLCMERKTAPISLDFYGIERGISANNISVFLLYPNVFVRVTLSFALVLVGYFFLV